MSPRPKHLKEHSLSNMPLLEVFRHILSRESTGTLVLKTREQERRLSFQGGFLVQALSERPHEQWETFLKFHPKVGTEKFATLHATWKLNGLIRELDPGVIRETLDSLVLQKEWLTRGELDQLRQNMVREIFFSILNRKDETYAVAFHPETIPVCSVRFDNLLFEGMILLEKHPEIQTSGISSETWVRLTPGRVKIQASDEAERKILNYVRVPVPLWQLARLLGMSSLEIAPRLIRMSGTGRVTLESELKNDVMFGSKDISVPRIRRHIEPYQENHRFLLIHHFLKLSPLISKKPELLTLFSLENYLKGMAWFLPPRFAPGAKFHLVNPPLQSYAASHPTQLPAIKSLCQRILNVQRDPSQNPALFSQLSAEEQLLFLDLIYQGVLKQTAALSEVIQ